MPIDLYHLVAILRIRSDTKDPKPAMPIDLYHLVAILTIRSDTKDHKTCNAYRPLSLGGHIENKK